MSRRLVMSESASGCYTSLAPVIMNREVKEDYVCLSKDGKEAQTDKVGSVSLSRSGRTLAPCTTDLKYQTSIDVTGSSAVFSKTFHPGDDAMFAEFAKLYDEVKINSIEITIDGRDLLHNCDSATPSTSGFIISGVWGATKKVAVNPTTGELIWDRSDATVLSWSSAKPVLHKKLKGPFSETYISTGELWPSDPSGYYSAPRLAAQTANDWQFVRLWLGFNANASQLLATTHNYVAVWFKVNVTFRSRRGA